MKEKKKQRKKYFHDCLINSTFCENIYFLNFNALLYIICYF